MIGLDPIDRTWAGVVERVPDAVRPLARRLPWELGLTATPEGGWTDYVRLPVTRDLPAFAAEAARERLSPEQLARYREAHHCGGFYCLLIDRVADRQARSAPGLPTLRRALLASWRRALTAAIGDATAAGEAIRRALRAWSRGVRTQRALARAPRVAPGTYLGMCRDRFRWAGTAAFCLLERAAPPASQGAFAAAFDRYMLALQCLDDARDAEEDERLQGTSAARALGLPRGALQRAATHFAREALLLASAGGQSRFSRSLLLLLASLDALEKLEPGGDPLADEVAALVLVESARREPVHRN